MCGRFVVTLPPDAMAQLFKAVPANDLPNVPNYNVCPTTRIAVIRNDDSGRKLVSMRWGFIPKWYKSSNDGPLLINARAETIAEKPAFRAACRARRCLIPAAGFYEWTKDADGNRLPWYIKRANHELTVMAGIWQDWEFDGQVLSTCAIVTIAANKSMSTIHHRMPVVLDQNDIGVWLGEGGEPAAPLMQSAPDDTLIFQRVDRSVNSNRASGPELIEPFTG